MFPIFILCLSFGTLSCFENDIVNVSEQKTHENTNGSIIVSITSHSGLEDGDGDFFSKSVAVQFSTSSSVTGTARTRHFGFTHHLENSTKAIENIGTTEKGSTSTTFSPQIVFHTVPIEPTIVQVTYDEKLGDSTQVNQDTETTENALLSTTPPSAIVFNSSFGSTQLLEDTTEPTRSSLFPTSLSSKIAFSTVSRNNFEDTTVTEEASITEAIEIKDHHLLTPTVTTETPDGTTEFRESEMKSFRFTLNTMSSNINTFSEESGTTTEPSTSTFSDETGNIWTYITDHWIQLASLSCLLMLCFANCFILHRIKRLSTIVANMKLTYRNIPLPGSSARPRYFRDSKEIMDEINARPISFRDVHVSTFSRKTGADVAIQILSEGNGRLEETHIETTEL
jgi:hypothetical protein